jgi:hypothetical protein
VDSRQLRRARKRRAKRRRRLAAAAAGALCGAWLLSLAGFGGESAARKQPRPTNAHRLTSPRPAPPPPQFVVVSFDGSGGVRLWPYWRSVARRAHAHFTFLVSGVYLVDEAHRNRYRPPRHAPGSSDIGFASDRSLVGGMRRQMAAAFGEGHEIGTHYNGHFCAPYDGSVGEWTAADWEHELDEFFALLDPTGRVRLPFSTAEVVGARTPCLEGRLRTLYRVLARRGFRYDASQIATYGSWPRRELGIWSMPLLEIPFPGHTYDVVSMDYNFLANQSGVDPASIERETFLALRHAFVTSYYGNRAPLSIGMHFETWESWAYNRAVARLLLGICRLPGVRCVSYRELADWLDAQPPRALRRARAGRFSHLKRH